MATRGRLWLNDGSCVRQRAGHKDHVWSYGFVMARTHDGKSFRMLTLIDEHTRECLAVDVARSLKSDDVLERLAWLFVTRGVPKHIATTTETVLIPASELAFAPLGPPRKQETKHGLHC